jgi:Cu(I)/Ag(I) efflux system protein CusF
MNAWYKFSAAAILALSSAISVAYAQTEQQSGTAANTAESSGASSIGQVSQSAADMSEGEIRKVDKEAGKITIKHGPLKNLDMPAMTMIFKAKDPAMLEQVKPGDKISFVADKVNGQITVTQIELKQ